MTQLSNLQCAEIPIYVAAGYLLASRPVISGG